MFFFFVHLPRAASPLPSCASALFGHGVSVLFVGTHHHHNHHHANILEGLFYLNLFIPRPFFRFFFFFFYYYSSSSYLVPLYLLMLLRVLPYVKSGPFFCAQQALTPLFNAPSMAQDNLAGLMGFFFLFLLLLLLSSSLRFFAVLVAEGGAPGLPRCHYED